ncbi:PASTA domain-containing protein [Enterococcus olivae]
MSDFLSNFTKNNYDGKKKEPVEKKQEEESTETEEVQESVVFSEGTIDESSEKATNETAEETEDEAEVETSVGSRSQKKEAPVSRFQTEETEFDPTYKKRQRKKYLIIGLVSTLAAVLLFFLYYQLTHVKVPDFADKEISEVRTWGSEEGVVIQVDQAYDFDTEVNHVISQETAAGKRIRKGKTLTIEGSLGADPEEQLELPDFSELKKTGAEEWIAQNKAENVSLIEAFDDKIKQGDFIKQEAANKELNLEEYQRKDRLNVYYSKGKEVFEKNIDVPDFKGKALTDVEEWAKNNEVKLKTEKDFSNDILLDMVISQETEKGQKVAKHDELVIHVSKGKAIEVPDFSKYTMDEAASIESQISVIIKSVYSSSVNYGRFLSQSVEAEKKYAEGDDLPVVEVVYSEGKPYMQDLRGSTIEGDLPKLFFDQFQSKGASIYYSIYYVDSYEPKGTVVQMSHYGQFLPMELTISIGISLGNLSAPPQSFPEPEPEEEILESEE